jgi:guanylate kinase
MMNSENGQPQTCLNITANPLAIVISGPSGVGKDAILKRLKDQEYPLEFITTVTTRRQRATEKNLVDYRFISVDEYQKLLNGDGLLESANVYGNWYGVPRAPVKEALSKGKDTIIKVDVQGAANIKKTLPEAVFIFISPPSLEELSNRLSLRRTETPADLAVRLKTAESEIRQVDLFDYVVQNPCNQIDLAIRDILAIIRSEKCRVKQRKVEL